MHHYHPRPYLTMLLLTAGLAIVGSWHIQVIAAIPGASVDSVLAQRRLSPQLDFFEQGQQQLQQETVRLQQQAPSPVLTVSPSPGYWQPITSSAGHFSIWMSPGTLSEETRELDTEIGKLQFKGFASNFGNDRSVVAYTDLPQSTITQSPDQVFTAIRDRLKSRTSYAITDDQSISLNTYAGRSLTFSGSGEIITVRYYLAKQRLYLIGTKHKGNSLSNTATTFLSSFQILSH